jgi:hypothetical protein
MPKQQPTLDADPKLDAGARPAGVVEVVLKIALPARGTAALAVYVIRLRLLRLFAFGRRFLSIRFSPLLGLSFARFGWSSFARSLLSDHRRFKLLHERQGAGQCCFRVQINKIAQMEKTRHAVLLALLSKLGDIDIDCIVWPKKRRHLFPAARAVAGALAKCFNLL